VRETLRSALDRLAARLGPLAVAPLYRTAPVSPVPQPEYLNTAAAGRTAVPPAEALALARELERAAGRDPDRPPGRGPAERWGPRPLDVDLLVWGDVVSPDPELTLPHPRLRERGFVLVPLADVAPDLPVPPDGATVAELLARLGEVTGVERVGW